MDDADAIQNGDELGGLKPVRRLGSGAVGEVWLAHDAAGREVALKRIPIDTKRGRSVHTRELAALELLAEKLGDQSGLIHIFHVGISDDELWYTMELADIVGDPPVVLSLDQAINKGVSAAEVLDVIEHLLNGLVDLHEAGVVHRDIKPTNILSVGGEWKLGDIGLLSEERTEMTAVGTPDFIPPWGPIDRRADLYAMGRVLYCLITGLPARSFPTLPDELVTPERKQETKLINALIMRACEPDPEKRYQSAAEFVVAVQSARRGINGGVLLTRRHAMIAGGGALACAVAAPAIWPLIRSQMKADAQWISLFDGQTLDGWFSRDPGHHGTWMAEGGAIRCVRDDQFKSISTEREFEFGRFRATISPGHDHARLGLTYGHPRGSMFLLHREKYLWIRGYKDPNDSEEAKRWLSFPGPVIPLSGESIEMEVQWGKEHTRLLVNGELLHEVPGLAKAGTVGLHVWGKDTGDEVGDSGSFRDIEFQPLA